MPPDFLNSREDAIVFWSVAIIGFALCKDFRGVGASIIGVVGAFFQHKLLLLFGGALLYSVAVVYAGYRLGLWHRASLKETVYWFVGTGVALAGKAVTVGARSQRDLLRSVMGGVIAVAVIIEFVVNVYAMPFVFELVGIFLILAFAGMQVTAQRDASIHVPTRQVIDAVLIAIGAIYLVDFIVRVAADASDFFSRETAEAFLVTPVLTIALIPFLLAAAALSRWEQHRLQKRSFSFAQREAA